MPTDKTEEFLKALGLLPSVFPYPVHYVFLGQVKLCDMQGAVFIYMSNSVQPMFSSLCRLNFLDLQGVTEQCSGGDSVSLLSSSNICWQLCKNLYFIQQFPRHVP